VAVERTLIIIKPDGVQRRLIGQVLSRFESKGLKFVALRMMKISGELSDQHYAEHVTRPFYPSLREFITSGPVVVLALEGKNAISVCRTLVGATDAGEASPGTIRGDLGMSKGHNVIHASDGPESAARELALYFGADDFVDYHGNDRDWVYDVAEDLK